MFAMLGGGALAAGCGDSPTPPEHPTWADVEPILRGRCTGCHGGSADVTGTYDGLTYRFDFYDMSADTCGMAAQALPVGQTGLAANQAALIASDVRSPGSGWPPKMPPAPASALLDWQQETLRRWAADGAPKGAPRSDNHRPDIQLGAQQAVVDERLTFSAVISDPDGESVVGGLLFGDMTLTMTHPGAFAATLDTSTWAPGIYPVKAVLCDGWDSFEYELGNAEIKH